MWGSGLGGHESIYFLFFEGKPFESSRFFGLNYNSAHSLTIRILSEAGLLGIFAYMAFLVKTYIKSNSGELLVFHSISISCIGHFFSKSLKLGAYIDYGTPFFLVVLLVNFYLYRGYVRENKR